MSPSPWSLPHVARLILAARLARQAPSLHLICLSMAAVALPLFLPHAFASLRIQSSNVACSEPKWLATMGTY